MIAAGAGEVGAGVGEFISFAPVLFAGTEAFAGAAAF
jgi:hypothetical protein